MLVCVLIKGRAPRTPASNHPLKIVYMFNHCISPSKHQLVVVLPSNPKGLQPRASSPAVSMKGFQTTSSRNSMSEIFYQ